MIFRPINLLNQYSTMSELFCSTCPSMRSTICKTNNQLPFMECNWCSGKCSFTNLRTFLNISCRHFSSKDRITLSLRGRDLRDVAFRDNIRLFHVIYQCHGKLFNGGGGIVNTLLTSYFCKSRSFNYGPQMQNDILSIPS